MTNVCKKCGETVTPDPDDGHCPKCGSKAGYTVSRTFTFKHKIEDGVEKYNKQVKRLKEFQEIYKGTKVEENLAEKIKKLQGIIGDLQSLLPKEPKQIKIDESIKITDEVKVRISKQGVADATDSILQRGDEIVETSNNEIMSELRSLRKENTELHNSNSRLSKLGILGAIGGAAVGLVGSYLITSSSPPQIIIINATNVTNGIIIP